MTELTTVRCPDCGTSLEEALHACPHCGAASPSARTAELSLRPSGRHSTGVEVTDAELLPLLAELRAALEPQLLLLKPLAKGGMGLVYLARDPALKRLVVVKVLAPALAQNERARARFKREAEAAAAVAHPNVVSIYEVGELPKTGTSYIVMQYVEGPTLNEAFPGGTVAPESEARRILSEVAGALAAAHARRLVHRDIKPTNVILDRSTGRAVVLDFGISAILVPSTPTISGRFTSARLTGGHPILDHTIQSGLTSEGMVIGTPYYMSPEQAAMEQVTPKSDVYSLGVLAFELVTGGLPFVEATPAAMAAAHLNQAPPRVEGLRHDLDPEFSALIDRCLAKTPAERPSAEAIARALMPEAATKVEWPPPGLDRLTGRGWRALATAASAEYLALAALAVSPWLGAFESAQAAGVISTSATVIFTLLMLRAGTTAADAMTGLLRGLRAGYPREILIDAALDRRRDASDLVNGLGPFALVAETGRKGMLRARRDGAGVHLAGVGGTGILAGLWSLGIMPADPVGLIVVAAPVLLTALARALITLPERRVRLRASREAGYRGFGRTPPIRAELVKGWLEDAGVAAPRTAGARERLSLEILTFPWLLLIGPLVALIVAMLAKRR